MTKWLFKIPSHLEYIIINAGTLREAKMYMYANYENWVYVDYIAAEITIES